MHWITLPIVLIIALVMCVFNRDEDEPDYDTEEPHGADSARSYYGVNRNRNNHPDQ
jgi:hypothetical protein